MRDKDFAARLAAACDDHSALPPKGEGRQVSIAKKLKVSEEAVRKWFSGEARPRPGKMKELATLLNCDLGWLSLGIKPDMTPSERKLYGKRTEGVAYLAMGLSMLAGATCARPNDHDPRREYVDFYMILNSEQVAVKTVLGRETEDGAIEFVVPHDFKNVRNVGFVQQGAKYHMLDLDAALLEKHKVAKAGDFAVKVKAKSGAYSTGHDEWPRMNSISELVS